VQTRLGRGLLLAAKALPVSRKNFSLDFKLKRFASGLGHAPDFRHQAWMGSFLPEELRAVFDPNLVNRALARDPYSIVAGYRGVAGQRDGLDDAVYQYARLYLTACVLVKVDRASMACGLEVRAPLLDTAVVEFACALPGRLKLRGLTTKYILKEAVRPWLPAEIIDRPKKGFGVPVGEWLRGPLRDLARDLLSTHRLKAEGNFDPRFVTRLLDEHLRGVADHRKPLWTLLAFQLWNERYGPDSPHLRATSQARERAQAPSSVLLRL
jgi:asparagine synthase (glutamine-hydrolysing)